MSKKIKVVAYCRISTLKNDQINSYEAQKSFFERELANNEEYELYKIYADKGISATSYKREQFLNMIFDAGINISYVEKKIVFTKSDREPLFSKIFVSNTSRFARNTLAIDVIRELRNKGVSVNFLDSGRSTEDVKDDSWINMFLIFAQDESVQKSTRVSFGHMESAKQGKLFVNGQLYGYDYFSETKELKIIEKEAEIVREMFEMYGDGKGLRQIVNHLEKKGIVTRKGKPFGKTSIARILQNEKYMGDLVRNKYTTGVIFSKHSYAKLKDKKEWMTYENRVPAIVSKDLFNEVQKIKESKSSHVRGINRGHSEFAGLIKCGKCGSSYTKNSHSKKDQRHDYPFYNCSLKKAKGKSECDNPNVKLEWIELLIKNVQKDIHTSYLLERNGRINTLNILRNQLVSKIDQDMTKLAQQKQEEIDILSNKKKKLLDLYIEESISKDDLTEKSIEMDTKLTIAEGEVKELTMSNQELHQEIEQVDTQIEKLNSFNIKKEYTREEAISIIESIEVKLDDDFHFHLSVEFKVDETISRLVKKHVPDFKDFKLGGSILFLDTPKGYEPKQSTQQWYTLKDGIDPIKHQQKSHERTIERIKK